jgi:hypothetical protein
MSTTAWCHLWNESPMNSLNACQESSTSKRFSSKPTFSNCAGNFFFIQSNFTRASLKPNEVQRLCTEARKMLLQWRESYLKVREKIEASGRDSRWEFDRRRLFDKTDYQATICNELIKISIVLEEFYNIFGPELKAVTGEYKRIEEVLGRVKNLITRIKSVRLLLWYFWYWFASFQTVRAV